jgi:hypothetical protein
MRRLRWPLVVAVLATYTPFANGARRVVAQGRGAPSSPLPRGAARPPSLVFGSDVAVVLNFVKPDRTADFENVIARLKEALQRSERPERKQQAIGWRMFRATEPGPSGSVIYLFVIDQPLKGADYTIPRVLAEAFPAEAQALEQQLTDSLTQAQSSLDLRLAVTLHK